MTSHNRIHAEPSMRVGDVLSAVESTDEPDDLRARLRRDARRLANHDLSGRAFSERYRDEVESTFDPASRTAGREGSEG